MSIWSLTFWCYVNLVPTVKYWTKFANVSNELNKLLFPCHLGEYLEYNVISHTHTRVCGRQGGACAYIYIYIYISECVCVSVLFRNKLTQGVNIRDGI